jgi:transcription antitermination factor NusG
MWNVVHTKPNYEAHVSKFLGVHGIESYAPHFAPPGRTRPGSIRDRRRRLVFPGYVFLRVPHQFCRWDLVQWAPGVRRVLTANGAPATVPEAVLERIRARAFEEVSFDRRVAFSPGQRVVIERGPLAMVDAIFDKALNTSERVQVLVHLLGRPMAVAVDATILRPAS